MLAFENLELGGIDGHAERKPVDAALNIDRDPEIELVAGSNSHFSRTRGASEPHREWVRGSVVAFAVRAFTCTSRSWQQADGIQDDEKMDPDPGPRRKMHSDCLARVW